MNTEGRIELSTTITKKDLSEYWSFIQSKQKEVMQVKKHSKKKTLLFNIIMWLITFSIIFTLLRYDVIAGLSSYDINTAITVATFFILIIILWFVFYIQALRKYAQSDWGDYQLGDRSFVLNKEGISHQAKNSSSMTHWSVFKDIHETETLLVVMISSCAGVIIPKSCFANEAVMDRVITFSKHHIEVNN